MAKIKLMSHLVAGFPSDELALCAARALVAGGADILEIQLPFSDPSADGPAIQTACTEVLSRGYRTADGLAFIKKLHAEFPAVTIYLMSYGSLVYTPGVEAFCARAAEAGVSGMIIPDLPFDHDEGLTAACRANGMVNIPVAAPGMAPDRLAQLAGAGFPFIYAALRAGITGSDTIVQSLRRLWHKHGHTGAGARIVCGSNCCGQRFCAYHRGAPGQSAGAFRRRYRKSPRAERHGLKSPAAGNSFRSA